ncbi:hypothetical protein PG987_014382 [Apiospora arundinis]
MHQSTSVVAALLGSVALLVSPAAAALDSSELDDPSVSFRTCSPLSVKADTPFLVKAVNYTRYHDTLGGGAFDPDAQWNSLQVYLAVTAGNKSLGCSHAQNPAKCDVPTTAPVCVLIDCIPLNQDPRHLSNGGATEVTDFVIPGGVPGGAGPDGPWYDLAITEFARHATGYRATLANLSATEWRKPELYGGNSSSLRYDNGWRGFNLTDMDPKALDGTFENTGFYPYELQGHPWPGLHRVPCAAYPCARKCANAALGTKFEAEWTRADYANARSCIDKCEGVDTVVNFCPDAYGGKQQVIDPQALGLDSQAALAAYVPDGCAVFQAEAFPAAAASYSASMASKTSSPSSASSATASPTGKSGASGNANVRDGVTAALAVFTVTMAAFVFSL